MMRVDPVLRKGLCSKCGFVSAYKARDRWRCAEKQREYRRLTKGAPSRLPVPETHIKGSHYHRMSDVDPDTRIGTCQQCGPGVRAKPEGNGRWRCYDFYAQARNRLSRERRERARLEKIEALQIAYATLSRVTRATKPGPTRNNLRALAVEMRERLERATAER